LPKNGSRCFLIRRSVSSSDFFLFNLVVGKNRIRQLAEENAAHLRRDRNPFHRVAFALFEKIPRNTDLFAAATFTMWPAIAVVFDPPHLALLHRTVFVFVLGPKDTSHATSF